MKVKTICTLIGVFLLILMWVHPSLGEMSSPSYILNPHTQDGGGLQSFSEFFRLISAIGQPTPIGFLQSINFYLQAGFLTRDSITNVTTSQIPLKDSWNLFSYRQAVTKLNFLKI